MKLSMMLPPLHCRVPSDCEDGTLIMGREYCDNLGLRLTPPLDSSYETLDHPRPEVKLPSDGP